MTISRIKQRLDIQIALEEGNWMDEQALADVSDRVLEASAAFIFVHEKQPFPKTPVEISLLFTDDASIREINAEWRKQDKPTNVLSFPAFPLEPGGKPGPMLGDIIFAEETIRREALEHEKPFEEHLTHLLVHGFLHLFGYDHMNDADAERMEALETRILAELGVSDPYGDSSPL